jgi:arsenate reductase
MAAALLDHHASGRVVVRSAGSIPVDEINPAVLAAMGEIGLDLRKEFPKPLTTEAVEAADVVVSMGCRDACPIFPGKRYLDWDLPDPAGKPVEEVRPIRDDIEQRVLASWPNSVSLRSKYERNLGAAARLDDRAGAKSARRWSSRQRKARSPMIDARSTRVIAVRRRPRLPGYDCCDPDCC